MPIDDTGWRKPELVRESGEAKGLVRMPTVTQEKPCFACRHFENDNAKLIQHLLARGLTPDADGFFTTPIAREIEGRESLRIHPRDFGWCRKDCIVTGMVATCKAWDPTQFREEMAAKVRR